MTNTSRSVWRAIVLAGVLLSVTACQANFDVSVEVEDDGSGMVTTEIILDQEASEALLDLGLDSSGLPLRDLAESGWTIGSPVEDASGRTRITASKAFGTPTQFSEVMVELAGEDGVIRDFALIRRQSFGRVDYAVIGELDSQQGLAAFSDTALEETLGRSVESIITSPPYNATASDISLSITVVLPGERQAGTAGAVAGGPAEPTDSWDLNLGKPDTVNVELRSTRRSQSAQVLRGVAVVAGVLAALIAFAQLLRIVGSRRRATPARRARPTDARGRPAEPEPEPTTELTADPDEPPADVDDRPAYNVVALDGMGVLYKEADDVHQLLIPFARQRGCTLPDEEIETKTRQLSLGRMTPADFWTALGVAGDPNELDSAYLAGHQLMPGVVRYLRSLRDQGVRVACITNDAAGWAMKLRAGHSLDALIDPWVVSGSVGVRKPDAPLFEVLRRVTSEPPASILIVDDNLDSLDAARELGFGTAWFTADGERADARGHDLLRSFEIGVEEEPPPAESPPILSP